MTLQLGFKYVKTKWRVLTLLKGCNFDDGLWALWNVVSLLKVCDLFKGCAFSKVLWPFWKVVFFPKNCDLYPLFDINWELISYFSTLNSSLLLHTFLTKENGSIVSVCVIRCCHFEFVGVIKVWDITTSLLDNPFYLGKN